MTEIPDNPEELFAGWRLQDNFEDMALEILTAGAHLGALALAKNVTFAEIANGNRTLRKDEMMRLVEAAKLEVRETTKKGINDARRS